MGALHDGHMSLVRNSLMENDVTVVSIFVNPTQFAPGEDFEAYPREPEQDISRLREAGVDTLFMPGPDAIYPDGFSTSIDIGEIGGKLCGAFRPGHFNGVASVVAKLFNIVQPTRAYFGLKDYQQVLVIKRLVADLSFPVEVVPCPAWRESDGLAMSSRNAYLSAEERKTATVINRGLKEAEESLKSGTSPDEAVRQLRSMLDAETLVSEVQYAGVYDPGTLEPLESFSGKGVIAVAVKVGKGRLIDNLII
jgi:pantoate--beta-alanine ligase